MDDLPVASSAYNRGARVSGWRPGGLSVLPDKPFLCKLAPTKSHATN